MTRQKKSVLHVPHTSFKFVRISVSQRANSFSVNHLITSKIFNIVRTIELNTWCFCSAWIKKSWDINLSWFMDWLSSRKFSVFKALSTLAFTRTISPLVHIGLIIRLRISFTPFPSTSWNFLFLRQRIARFLFFKKFLFTGRRCPLSLQNESVSNEFFSHDRQSKMILNLQLYLYPKRDIDQMLVS